MKLMKKSISLPEDLYRFAEENAEQIARERGTSQNISAYIRELLVREKNKAKQREPRALAA